MLTKHKGSVLLLALVVLSVIAAVSMLVLTRSTNAVVLSQKLIEKEKHAFLLTSVLSWAEVSLLKNPAPVAFPEVIVDGEKLSGELIDAQALLNINLIEISGQYNAFSIFEDLFKARYPSIDSPDRLVRFISRWVGEFRMGSSQYDEHYREKPYLPAHRDLVNLNSLLLVDGMTDELLHSIKPFIVALPDKARLNINTVCQTLLMNVVPGISETEAAAFIAERDKHPFKDLIEVAKNPILQRHQFHNLQLLTTQSDYFILNARIKNKSVSRQWLLKRVDDKVVEVLWVS